jgi:hypothetical protein
MFRCTVFEVRERGSMELGTMLDLATLAAVSVDGFLLSLARSGLEARVKTSAEEGTKLALRNSNWAQELSQELEKVRGTRRQELRFKSYGLLWEKLRPLAIYDTAALNRQSAGELSHALSGWYFSAEGGLMLTSVVREFYFALQDLLRTIAGSKEWQVERSEADHHAVFRATLDAMNLKDALTTLDYFTETDRGVESGAERRGDESLAKGWRADKKKDRGRLGSSGWISTVRSHSTDRKRPSNEHDPRR